MATTLLSVFLINQDINVGQFILCMLSLLIFIVGMISQAGFIASFFSSPSFATQLGNCLFDLINLGSVIVVIPVCLSLYVKVTHLKVLVHEVESSSIEDLLLLLLPHEALCEVLSSLHIFSNGNS